MHWPLTSHSDHIVQTKGQAQNMWSNEWQGLNIKFTSSKKKINTITWNGNCPEKSRMHGMAGSAF